MSAMTAAEIRLAHAAWKLLNRKYHLSRARFERVAKKEPLAKVVALVQTTYGVKIEQTDDIFHMDPTEAKPKAQRAAKKPAKKPAKKAAAKKTAAAKPAAKKVAIAERGPASAVVTGGASAGGMAMKRR